MPFLDSGTGTLEDILGQQAENASNTISRQYAKKRRQSVAQQAHLGRLTSGVSNYQAGDIDTGEVEALGDIEGALSSALAEVPVSDYSTQQDNARKRQLVELLAELSQESGGALGGALGGLEGALSGAASGFMIGGPAGAVAGGALGGGLGAYGGMKRKRG